MGPAPVTTNTCFVRGSSCRMSSTSARIVVDDRNGHFVLAQRRVAKKSLIDGREQERGVGKELLSILAREDRRRAGDRHDELRLGTIGEGGSDVVDDRLFGCADEPCWSNDDLDDVHGSADALVEVCPEVGVEGIEDQAAAVGPPAAAGSAARAHGRGAAPRSATPRAASSQLARRLETHWRAPRCDTNAAIGRNTPLLDGDDIHLPIWL